MDVVLALLAPGQGSQSPGMFAPWLELDGTRERVAGWSELTGLDLIELGTVADADAIKDTAITQPLVVALALLAFEELERRHELPADVLVAGHSVGELAAAAMAGVLSADDAVALAAVRGREMAAACELAPDRHGRGHGWRARARSSTGSPSSTWCRPTATARARSSPPVRSTRIDKIVDSKPDFVKKIIKLKVAGAFHTHYMAPARDALREKAAGITVADPTRTLLSNADGEVVTSGTEMLRPAGRAGHAARAMGRLHGDDDRARRRARSPSCRRPARSPGSPGANSPASRSPASRSPRTSRRWPPLIARRRRASA